MIIPHRRSLWARSDKTPFGRGTFQPGSVKHILQQADFVQIQIKHSLYAAFGARLLPAVGRFRYDRPYWLGDVWRRADRGCWRLYSSVNSHALQQ